MPQTRQKMSIQNLFQDLKDAWGSLSLRYRRITSQVGAIQNMSDPLWETDLWALVPPEILREVIGRIEKSSSSWPDRRNLLVCAAVCRSWRDTCFEMVRPPELSGQITFLASLKQPGPRDGFMKCFIKRNKLTQTYSLSLSLSEDVVPQNGKFLMAARKYYYGTHTEYIISHSKHFSSSSRSCIGKLRSNFVGTKYVIYEAEFESAEPTNGDLQSVPQISKWTEGMIFFSKKSSVKFSQIGNMSYKQNFGGDGPRKIHCVMHSIPCSDTEGTDGSSEIMIPGGDGTSEMPLVLQNKNPRWHEQLQCWCLNFSGRVTIASVKNFQLVEAGSDPPRDTNQNCGDSSVILQFGKVANDIFTMDYQYPLSAFQAFAISLTSFDRKLASE